MSRCCSASPILRYGQHEGPHPGSDDGPQQSETDCWTAGGHASRAPFVLLLFSGLVLRCNSLSLVVSLFPPPQTGAGPPAGSRRSHRPLMLGTVRQAVCSAPRDAPAALVWPQARVESISTTGWRHEGQAGSRKNESTLESCWCGSAV